MNNLILVFLCLLPFSALVINKVDIWKGQLFFTQGAILIVYCYHLFKKNRPLAVLFAWIGISTLVQFVSIFVMAKQYAVMLVLPFLNLICAVLLFDVITTYCNKEFFTKFIKYFSVVFLIILSYCLLQKFGLDQFYRSVDMAIHHNNNEIVGIIGNSMHNAHFIAIGFPVLFVLRGWWRRLAVLFALLILVFTGTSSGLVTAIIIILFANVFLRMFKWYEIVGVLILGVILLSLKYHGIGDFIQKFSFTNGRAEIWRGYWPIFNEKPIMGWGLGFTDIVANNPQSKFYRWHHLHFEFYQIAVETGLISLGLVIWGIIDYFRRFKKDETSVIMVSMFLAFLLVSLTGFPMHLWVLSILGIVAYSFNYIRS